MQAEGKLPPGAKKKYPSAFKAYGIIARQEFYEQSWDQKSFRPFILGRMALAACGQD